MRDTLSEWGQATFVTGVIVTAIVRGWRHLWRMLIFMARPDIYERLQQALEWEREQNRILQSRIDRLTSDRSGGSPSDRPGGADTSTE